MVKDFSPKIRQRADLSRKQARRANYDRLLIVCEGSKTEPNYFKEIRQEHRLHTANVAIHPSKSGTAPIQVVQYAKELVENGNPHRKIKPGAVEQVYVVFDRDTHASFHEACLLVRSLDSKLLNDNAQPILFRAIVSVPNFELWLLLHFENIERPLHRDEVLKRLKRHMPSYKKAIANSFALTRHQLDVAHQRAKVLTERHTPIDGIQPYTDVSGLVALLTKLCNNF